MGEGGPESPPEVGSALDSWLLAAPGTVSTAGSTPDPGSSKGSLKPGGKKHYLQTAGEKCSMYKKS